MRINFRFCFWWRALARGKIFENLQWNQIISFQNIAFGSWQQTNERTDKRKKEQVENIMRLVSLSLDWRKHKTAMFAADTSALFITLYPMSIDFISTVYLEPGWTEIYDMAYCVRVFMTLSAFCLWYLSFLFTSVGKEGAGWNGKGGYENRAGENKRVKIKIWKIAPKRNVFGTWRCPSRTTAHIHF